MIQTSSKKARANDQIISPTGIRGLYFVRVDGDEDPEKFDDPEIVEAPEDIQAKYPTGKTVVSATLRKGEVENSFVNDDTVVFGGILGKKVFFDGDEEVLYAELTDASLIYPRPPQGDELSPAHKKEFDNFTDFKNRAFGSSFTEYEVDGAFVRVGDKIYIRLEGGDERDFTIHAPAPSSEIFPVDLTPGDHYKFASEGVILHGTFVVEGPGGFVFKCPRFMQPDMQDFNDRLFMINPYYEGMELREEFTLGCTFVTFPSISLE